MVAARIGAGCLAAMLLVGCASGPLRPDARPASNKGLFTSTEIRAVHRTIVSASSHQGRVTPTYVTCAEPSPDVAKAFSHSLAAVSVARAEALAQLGERLAAIQLLRDGLYRACEAYANGALSDTSYAVLLSRTNGEMATMLLGEIAGGAFGRSLAALGTGAEGKASASPDTEQSESWSRQAEANLERAATQKAAAQEAVNAAVANGAPGAVQEAQKSLKEAEKAVEQAQSALKEIYQAAAESSAKALFAISAGKPGWHRSVVVRE